MRKLTIKQLTNISLLIAISVGLVYFGILLMGMSSIPNLRAGFAGIPIKMSGFIYGPVVGLVTGFVSDILGLIVFPTFFHPGYTLNLMLAGFIPGLIGMMYRKFKTKEKTLVIIANGILMIASALLLGLYSENQIFDSIIIGEGPKGAFNFALLAYTVQMFISLILFNIGYVWIRKYKPNYAIIYILLSMSVLAVDNVAIFLSPIWDQQSLGIDYITGLTLSMLYFGMKMWVNVILLFIIFTVLDKQISRQVEYSKTEDLTEASKNVNIKQKKQKNKVK